MYTRSRNRRQIDSMIDVMENDNLHNSYHFELEMYQYIREGNVERLKEFLHTNRMLIKEGKMAHTPVRHTKNLFITTAARTGFLGAIPGGVDIEKTTKK